MTGLALFALAGALMVLVGGSVGELGASFVIGACAGFAIYGLNFLLIPWTGRRIFRESAGLQEPHDYILADNDFTISQPSGFFRQEWSKLVKWDETTTLLMLFPNRAMAYLVPKSQVDPDFVQYARDRLEASGLSKPGRLRK